MISHFSDILWAKNKCFIKKIINCLINYKDSEIILGCYDAGWSVHLWLISPELFSQATWTSIVCSLPSNSVIYKREQPVSVWRSVWCYLRKVLKHAQWQDDRKKRRGERSVKRRCEEEDENNKVRRKEKVCKLGFWSFKQEMIWMIMSDAEHVLHGGRPSPRPSPDT